ncbi:substrate-binding domain-containing protein, partial [Mycobacterium tuberculosis]|nr:substrate-binding domain-containing protein [Mycobacterium tuberculosis]
VSQIQDLLAQNVDALIYIPAGATAASVPVKAARAAGVPVVNIDRNADGAPGDTFIATDSVASAKEVCTHLAKLGGGKGEMLIVHGQKGTTPEVDSVMRRFDSDRPSPSEAMASAALTASKLYSGSPMPI